MRVLAASVALTMCVGCATTKEHRAAGPRWPSDLTTGVVFLGFGVPSMPVGAGLFGYALAHKASPQSAVDFSFFVPGAALFGIAIPFITLGTILTVTGAHKLREQRRQWGRHVYGEPTDGGGP